MIENTLPDKSGNPESLKKQPQLFESFSANVPNLVRICWGRLQVVLFIILWFKWSVKKHCVAKVSLAIWETFFHENNRNYNLYRFSFKFAFIFFLFFLPNQKQESGNEKHFYFIFIAGRAVLQSHAEFNKLL